MNLSHFQNISHVNGEANLIVRNISRDKKKQKKHRVFGEYYF